MEPGVSTISVTEAARRLGVSPATVRNWLKTGLIAAQRGPQPTRPRFQVWVDEGGRPVNARGHPVGAFYVDGINPTMRELIARLEVLEGRIGNGPPDAEMFRDAALQLQAAMERQRRALELQLQASQELNAAVAEQAAVIAGLLIGDPKSALTAAPHQGSSRASAAQTASQ